ncbi:AC57-like protein [Orgyia pseudotsugata single capsid nuclopolyhedrovirus]|nr:AC57-like protein [Orgyia pseudotsugata single capsid nuclopolyhedrovirus]
MLHTVMTSINVKYLEFGEVSLDLRHVKFPAIEDKANSEYIIFLNVNKAFFSNFKIVCDLSLETLCQFIYENVRYTIDGVEQKLTLDYDRFVYNQHDKNKSIIIQFSDTARIIVAAAIKFDERYNQRVSGYIDFENRHCSTQDELSAHERNELDKKYEIRLLDPLT